MPLRSLAETVRLWRWIRAEDVPTSPLVLRTLVYPREAILRIRRAVPKGVPEQTAINQGRKRLPQAVFAKQVNPKKKEVGNRQRGAGAVHPEPGRVGTGRAPRNRDAMKEEGLMEEILTVLMLVALWVLWLMVPA